MLGDSEPPSKNTSNEIIIWASDLVGASVGTILLKCHYN